MKIAILADIHDNEVRLAEALRITRKEKIGIGICCGDIARLETLQIMAKSFTKLYVALGNMDHNLKMQTELFPDNVFADSKIQKTKISGKTIAIVHHDYIAREIAKENKYDIVFFGHTHTPWEKKIGDTTILNPGEISGQFGPASFAIYDLSTMKARLILIK
jgi:putative phosphoesterase